LSATRRDLRDECPNCGAELEPGAPVCPECGSDETTGWSEEAKTARLGLPDDSFDYGEFVERELEPGSSNERRLHWLWWLIALVVLAGMVWISLR
jgi:hypothetical protein